MIGLSVTILAWSFTLCLMISSVDFFSSFFWNLIRLWCAQTRSHDCAGYLWKIIDMFANLQRLSVWMVAKCIPVRPWIHFQASRTLSWGCLRHCFSEIIQTLHGYLDDLIDFWGHRYIQRYIGTWKVNAWLTAIFWGRNRLYQTVNNNLTHWSQHTSVYDWRKWGENEVEWTRKADVKQNNKKEKSSCLLAKCV